MANIVVAPTYEFYPFDMFQDLLITNVVSAGAELVSIALPSGAVIQFEGLGLAIDPSAENPWVAGTVAAVRLVDSIDGPIVSITDLSVSAPDLGAVLSANQSDFEFAINVMRFLLSGNDSYQGGNKTDVVYVGLGDDAVNSQGGSDYIYVGPGAATIDGGEGRDTLNFAEDFLGYPAYEAGLTINLATGKGTNVDGKSLIISGIEDLIGSLGNDTITATDADNFLFGNNGNDSIFGGGGNDIIYGGHGQDTLDGGAGDDLFSIGEMEMNTYLTGDKLLIGGEGHDTAYTVGALSDFLYAFNGDDNLVFTHKESGAEFTLVGIETIYDGLNYYTVEDFRGGIEPPATDILIAEDTFWSHTIPENFFGSGSVDITFMTDGYQPLPSWIKYDSATRTLSGTPPKDDNGALGLLLKAVVNGAPKTVYLNIDITPVNDAPTNLTMNNGSVVENAKVDMFIGLLKAKDVDNGAILKYELVDNAGGRFKLDGDRLVVADPAKIDYEQAESHSVTVKVSDQFGAYTTETFSIEIKDVGKEVAVGGTGGDILKGGSGSDKIAGGLGKDVLTGGKGKDAFIFNTKASKSNIDKITDFNVNDDSIYLENSTFTKLGRKGTEKSPAKLNKDFFTVGSKAKDKSDYLIYDSKKGVLYYDADGSNKGKATEIATLSKNLKMTADDFFVI